ncbi:non-intrinsic ABC protein 14 [Artemisia annua]|uniref:Non-intrinsic ABC protein 14 n=1 Tax=Artemisia annua TaxID=35608 RepID=A0A2U1LPH3_ARTAN|nr:non-intrinsic ABC protein 14 [Artemisia annua]
MLLSENVDLMNTKFLDVCIDQSCIHGKVIRALLERDVYAAVAASERKASECISLASLNEFCLHQQSLVKDIRYRPPGTQLNLLNDVSFTLPEKSFGMIFGRSGSGKTTLLQLIAGLTKPTSGSICIQRYNDDGSSNQPPVLLSPEKVGIVFQFPERYFIADNVLDEVIFGLPRQKSDQKDRELIARRLERAITAVGLTGIPLDKNPNSLSGGYKRRLALAIQLVRDIRYRPPGTQLNLLNDVSFTLPEKSFGMIFGRSGSGKTTLLQLIAGLTKPTSGSICIQRYNDDGSSNQPPVLLSPEKVGIVFQFPERYFIADNVLDEVIFGLPRQKSDQKDRELIARRLERAITAVGLTGIPLDKNPNSLSGGYKRRLALAIQLVQTPELLVLDEPLAGLDWKARADVVKLLKDLKKQLTILVVSHDLKELAPLVDRSWRMDVGGILKEEPLPI